ncbi:GNAT family N-acetyltransferase [Microbaculum marinum]|uniref:GNAT family N-acetyltransferase n=1 Tax=Microbaculum marinum TaxID=1764581 RepID=A0AAW9RZF5_9HYPH
MLEFIRELAEYEKLADEVTAREEHIDLALFGNMPRTFCEIAEWDGKPAGFAMWFYSFSTFRGQHGIYVEDLYVRPSFRGRGIGKAMLKRLAGRCLEEGLGRLEWSVLDWNEPSIGFYKSLGATALDGWTGFRASGEALDRLAASDE